MKGRFLPIKFICGLAAVGAALALASCASTSSAAPLIDSDIQEAEQTARAWMAERGFNGVVLVNWSGKDLIAIADGVADPQTGRRLTMQTRFETGSVEKYFVAIAAFRLIEKGMLDLDAPIATYLPDYRADTGARITLRSLLSNQSGLPNDILDAFRRAANGEAETIDALDAGEAVREFTSGDLKFEPGARFDYVLSNWLLAQHLLEQVAGEDYAALRASDVFNAAAMTQSGGYVHDMQETDPPVTDVAIGFDPEDANGRGDYWTPRFFRGSYATAGDMLTLERALSAGALMEPETVTLFRTVQAPEENYAFGGRYRTWRMCGEAHLISTQSGSNGATNIVSAYDVETGLGVALFTNVDDSQGDMFALAETLMNIAMGCAGPA